MKAFFALTALLASTPFAHAADRAEQIVNHPVVTALETLLQEQSNGPCALPTANDIRWACTGAIPTTKKAEILAMGCGFSLVIRCPAKSATISGWTKHYYLNTPKPNQVAPTQETIEFHDVTFLVP